MFSSTYLELKKVQELSSILSHLNITTFFQLRIFATGNFLVLSNSPEVYSFFESEQTIGNHFFQLIKNSQPGAINVNLWPSHTSDELLTKLHEMNIHHGISISYAIDNYVDIFSFATDQSHEGIINVYLNNVVLLKRFIVYFRFKAKKLLEQKTERSLFLNKKFEFRPNSAAKNLACLARFKKKLTSWYLQSTLVNKISKETVLTKKEMECLSHLLTGKSIKGVADEMNVSRKTVEACLKKVRTKAGFYTNDQLISIFNLDPLLIETL